MPYLKVTKGNRDELYPCGARVSVERFAGSIRIEPREPGEGCPESITIPNDAEKVYLVDNGVTVTGWVWPPRTPQTVQP